MDDHDPAGRGAMRRVSVASHEMEFLLPLPGVMMEGLASAVVTTSTGRCDRQLELKLVEVRTALLGNARDVAVGDAVADTDDHALNVMRILRIGKRSQKPALCKG